MIGRWRALDFTHSHEKKRSSKMNMTWPRGRYLGSYIKLYASVPILANLGKSLSFVDSD